MFFNSIKISIILLLIIIIKPTLRPVSQLAPLIFASNFTRHATNESYQLQRFPIKWLVICNNHITMTKLKVNGLLMFVNPFLFQFYALLYSQTHNYLFIKREAVLSISDSLSIYCYCLLFGRVNQHGQIAVNGTVITQLAVVVFAPAHGLVVDSGQNTGMMRTHGDRMDCAQVLHQGGIS